MNNQFTVTESFAKDRVDTENGIVFGVKVIGFNSINRRFYKPEALRNGVPLYEGAQVNIDHGGKPGATRSYAKRFGVLRNARYVEGEGVFADLHYNTGHQMASQFAFDAAKNHEALGLSHDATLVVAKSKDKRGRSVIEQIIKVKSVDVVSDPATTKNLFESAETMPETMNDTEILDPMDAMMASMADSAMDIFKGEGDDKTKLSKLRDMLKKQSKIKALMSGGEKSTNEMPKPKDDEMPKPNEATESVDAKRLDRLESLVVKFVEGFETKERSTTINDALVAAGLDPKNEKHVSESFSKQLAACESADDLADMIADRASLVKSASNNGRPSKPKSFRATESSGSAKEPLAENYGRSLLRK